jgi:PEGA domain-containing protein
MKKLLAVLVAGGVVLPAVGCASLVARGPDFVPVDSRPSGARVKLDGISVGKTPVVVPFERTCEGVLTFELEGYEPATVDVDKVPNGWFFGNLLWFPVWPVVPVGMVVDLCASNQGRYSTTPIRVELKARPNGSPAGSP